MTWKYYTIFYCNVKRHSLSYELFLFEATNDVGQSIYLDFFLFCRRHHKFRISLPIKNVKTWECVTQSCYKTPFCVCVCLYDGLCQPYHTCVRSIFLFFLPRVCVASVWVWRCSTCGWRAECGCALAQHTFWWMLPLYGISVMFRQCDIAVCFRTERWW